MKRILGFLLVMLVLGLGSCVNDFTIAEKLLKGGTAQVTTPAFSVASGEIAKGTSITITCATEGAKIYYTTDGSVPTASSTEYTAAISVTDNVTLKAIAVKDGMNNSEVASVSYTIKQTVAKPAFSVASGEIDSGTGVTISCATEGAKIYYTTDGSVPTASSTEYRAAISVTEDVTLKAIAVKDGMNNSEVASVSYTIKAPDYSLCAVGDFILKNGSILSKTTNLTAEQKSNVAAVIVRAAADGKPALGVGIVHGSGLKWCVDTASGYTNTIVDLVGNKEEGYMDGSNSWEILKTDCPDASDANTNSDIYPAWNFCLTYGAKNGLAETMADGWYLPTMAELYTIYQNKTTVDESLSKAGAVQFGNEGIYWSCCQGTGYPYKVRCLDFRDADNSSYNADAINKLVCSVKVFN